jgi:glycosyltransferase involved in cell wall biosynthesis
MQPTVSVVIPTFNRAQLLQKCLAALEAQQMVPGTFEVLVVDDGSTDHTIDLLETRSDTSPIEIRWFRQSHGGPAAARNLGISEAQGTLIAFTDDDCIPAPDWLVTLTTELSESSTCAGIGGPILGAQETAISRYIDRAKLMSHWVENGVVEYLITANALFRGACLAEIGGFETGFLLAGGEDVDLSYRLRHLGYSLRVTESGTVRHHHHDTLSNFFRMNWRHGFGAAQLVHRGFLPRRKTGFPALAKNLARSLKSQNSSGAKNLSESVIWRGLAIVQTYAKHAGYRAGLRQRQVT